MVSDQPCTAAVPFAMGVVQSTNELRVENSAGNTPPCTIVATGFWPDHSIKWCNVKWVAERDENGGAEAFSLNSAGQMLAVRNGKSVVVEDSPESMRISTNDFDYVFYRGQNKFFPDVCQGDVKLISADDVSIDFQSNGEHQLHSTSLKLVSHGPASATVQVDAEISLPSERHLKVTFKFEIISSWLKVVVQIHNPHRAQHPGALWELGDAGSICFSEFALRINRLQNQRVCWQIEHDRASEPATDNTVLFQASSGGQHWDSPTHIDAQGEIPNVFKGYRVESDGATVSSGDRASPQVWIESEGQSASAFGFTCRQYWQNFPKCIEIYERYLKLGLFPQQHGGEFELQGGERKCHEIVFSFDAKAASLQWVDTPAAISAPAEYIAATGAIRYADGQSNNYTAYDQVISAAHDAAAGFLAKREQIDEYGWRNFGDIFADHETLYHEADDIFVSHYNNQYDPIYGFARQYLLSADPRWQELLIDLAKHVMDIDIYRTTEDRAEYNHGLFWHTDHYKRAYACSHRTYSRNHYPDDWAGDMGGGPGSEHCYTSGLLLYYQMTGDTDARDAVLGLTSWIRYYYEGTGTVLEASKRLATDDRRTAVAICRGQNVFRYKYGFDRGVGNYIRALLDSYEATLQRDYIEQAETVIQGTFGSSDDIAARELDDIEGTWYYTVFLQEVIRYLDLKRTLNELDVDFVYARDALLHYAHWMAKNEQPYLDQPDRLEYPNDTWIAQDIRKANVLYAAYRYATSERTELLSRARFFRDYVVAALSRSETKYFARIQIIMLQNHGPSSLMDHEAEPYPGLDTLRIERQPDTTCFFTPASFVKHLLGGWGRALVAFNPRNEVKWLRVRRG